MWLRFIILILSAAVLAYQIVLMRIFSIAQWHHFAAMIISVALLGFGLSGTVFALARTELMRHWRLAFGVSAAGFVVTVPVGTWLAERVPFTPMLLMWQPRQLILLCEIYLLLLVPFCCAALAISLGLARAQEREEVGIMYGANLLGSGLGAVLGLMLGFLPAPVRISEYKGLPATLAMAGTRVVQTVHHPLGRIDVVEGEALRVAPGLSFGYSGPMPRQRVAFVDADGGTAINLSGTFADDMEYVDWLPSAAPFALRHPASVSDGMAQPFRSAERNGFTVPLPVSPISHHEFPAALIIGVGGGTELHQALRHRVHHIVGVESHPWLARAARRIRPHPRAPIDFEVVIADGRSFLRRRADKYDLIQISLLDSLSTSMTGVGAANESYLYTVEAFQEYHRRLTDDGVLAVTRWLKTPPRDNLRLFATVVAALERAGIEQPDRHLAFVRGWATGTLLMKRSPFTTPEIDRLRAWADSRVFDVDYFPGVELKDANQRNVMESAAYYEAFQAILFGDRQQFFATQLFDITPITDNRPYFFHSFRWRTAPHLWRTMGRDWVPFVEWGYIVLVAALVQAILAGAVLIGLPLLWRPAGSGAAAPLRAGEQRSKRLAVFVYFGALGLGFMFFEMVLLQKLGLFLGHPLYSVTVVIATLLCFAGIGAGVSARMRSVRWPIILIIVIGSVEWVAWPAVFRLFLATGDMVRAAIVILLLAPLAFFLGMPFPIGLGRIGPDWLPWAWSVNGCFSVIGAVLASVIAMDHGFHVLIVCALILYAAAGMVFSGLGSGSISSGNPPA